MVIDQSGLTPSITGPSSAYNSASFTYSALPQYWSIYPYWGSFAWTAGSASYHSTGSWGQDEQVNFPSSGSGTVNVHYDYTNRCGTFSTSLPVTY